jgi:hypothetical protein
VSLTGGHRHDVTQPLPLIDSLGPVRGKRGRPRTLYADRGYDYDIYRRRLSERGITPKIARLGQPHGRAWAGSGGSPSPPSPGSTAPTAYEPAGKHGTTCTTPSFNSPTA